MASGAPLHGKFEWNTYRYIGTSARMNIWIFNIQNIIPILASIWMHFLKFKYLLHYYYMYSNTPTFEYSSNIWNEWLKTKIVAFVPALVGTIISVMNPRSNTNTDSKSSVLNPLHRWALAPLKEKRVKENLLIDLSELSIGFQPSEIEWKTVICKCETMALSKLLASKVASDPLLLSSAINHSIQVFNHDRLKPVQSEAVQAWTRRIRVHAYRIRQVAHISN